MAEPASNTARVSEALTNRLKTMVVDFRAALYRHGHLHMAVMPLVSLVLQYLTRAIARFAVASKRDPLPPRRRAEPAPGAAIRGRARKQNPFPSKFAWLLALMPPTPISGALAGGARADIIEMLQNPDLLALLRANPAIGRIFRPLCHMFGIKQPDCLRKPPPPPPPPPPEPPAKPLAPRPKPGPTPPAATMPGASADAPVVVQNFRP